jgi:hypothetical protein
VGLIHPEIVLPRWALSLEPPDRELMIRHEEEHLAARDTPLLAAGLLLVLAFPWNLPLWWMIRRLGLAVEIDCDRRVLRSAPGTRRYADLLLAMASRAWAPRLRALALARPTPFLERRIRAMTDPSSPRVLRALAFTALSALLVFGACQVDGPTITTPDPANAVEVPFTLLEPTSSDLLVTGLRLLPRYRGNMTALSGTVLNRATNESVGAVQVSIPSLEIGGLTNTDGRFLILNIPPGDHLVTFQHAELGETRARVVVYASESPPPEPAAGDLLPPSPRSAPAPSSSAQTETGHVTGTVTEMGTGAAVAGAQVSIPALEVGGITNLGGRFLLINLPPGSYSLRIEKSGCPAYETEVVVTAGETVEVKAEMG